MTVRDQIQELETLVRARYPILYVVTWEETRVVNEIVRKVDLNEYKRKQAAPGLKITPLAFGVGRRIPIVQKYVS